VDRVVIKTVDRVVEKIVEKNVIQKVFIDKIIEVPVVVTAPAIAKDDCHCLNEPDFTTIFQKMLLITKQNTQPLNPPEHCMSEARFVDILQKNI
jgi:hypothetical protein